MPSLLSRLRSPWTPAVAMALLVATWLCDLVGDRMSPEAARAGAVLALAIFGVWSVVRVAAAVAGASEPARRERWAIALLVVALVVRLVGIQFELTDHPRNDEGVYIEMSQRIASGQLLPDTFNYGHFLYYAGALAMWLEETLPGPVGWLVGLAYGVDTPFEIDSILLRAVNAVLAALTTLAVWAIGLNLAGLATANLAALLITFSPLYNDVAHQLISDVPSAFFATLCLAFVSQLLDRERLAAYLLAGVAAGLAAGSKYPAGAAAIGIFAVWLYWRVRERTWSWSLPAAALAAILAMLAVMPALVLAPRAAFSGEGLDIFFGFRQYAYGGWLGVQPESAAGWYAERLLASFGWPAVLIGVTGIVWLGTEVRRRFLLLLPFPVAYLLLISMMSMVVRRNLQPVLPMLAVLLAAGSLGWVELGRRASLRHLRLLQTTVATTVLLLPLWHTLAFDIARTRPGTRQLARAWIGEHVPDGASILRESYTSVLDSERYDVHFLRFAAWLPLEDLLTTRWDYLLLAQPAFARFRDGDALEREHEQEFARRYETIFERLHLVREFEPGPLRAGSRLLLYRVEPPTVDWRSSRRFQAGDATWVSDPPLLRQGQGRPLIYTRHWQYAVFKDFFEPGRYLVKLETDRRPEIGYLYAVSPDNREFGTWELTERAEITLPERGKVLFRVFLPPPTQLIAWSLQRLEAPPGE
jgi:4-amino-4-deoxy-L-arabinose transferase-like glycosyltransferase